MRKTITISFDDEEIRAIMYWFMVYKKKKTAGGHVIARIDANTAAKITAITKFSGRIDELWKKDRKNRGFYD